MNFESIWSSKIDTELRPDLKISHQSFTNQIVTFLKSKVKNS